MLTFNHYTDNFIMIGNDWRDYIALCFMELNFMHTFVPHNQIPLPNCAILDISLFSQIRLLTVDTNLFIAMPFAIWTQFTELSLLTIAIYPCKQFAVDHNAISHGFREQYIEEAKFIKLKTHKSLFGKRAFWLQKEAARRIQTAFSKYRPTQQMPAIEVVLISADDEWLLVISGDITFRDMEIDGDTELIGLSFQPEYGCDGKEDLFPRDDLTWYESVYEELQETAEMDDYGSPME